MTAHTIYACQLAGGDWQARCSCGWTGRVFRKSGGALREREAHLDHTATRDTGDDLRELGYTGPTVMYCPDCGNAQRHTGGAITCAGSLTEGTAHDAITMEVRHLAPDHSPADLPDGKTA